MKPKCKKVTKNRNQNTLDFTSDMETCNTFEVQNHQSTLTDTIMTAPLNQQIRRAHHRNVFAFRSKQINLQLSALCVALSEPHIVVVKHSRVECVVFKRPARRCSCLCGSFSLRQLLATSVTM